jgi:hypothetical protein
MQKWKCIKRLVVVGLSVMCCMIFNGAITNAETLRTYSFTLEAGGDKKQTSAYTKENSNSYAYIWVGECVNNGPYTLPYRLRSGTNDTAASELYYIGGTGSRYPSYKSDYGIEGYKYYFRVQTDSNSAYGATIKGSWYP